MFEFKIKMFNRQGNRDVFYVYYYYCFFFFFTLEFGHDIGWELKRIGQRFREHWGEKSFKRLYSNSLLRGYRNAITMTPAFFKPLTRIDRIFSFYFLETFYFSIAEMKKKGIRKIQ